MRCFGARRINELHAVRAGSWKRLLPHRVVLFPPELQGKGGERGTSSQSLLELALYNLDADPSETKNLALDRPEVLGQLLAHAEALRAELGDTLTPREGRGNREPARWP